MKNKTKIIILIGLAVLLVLFVLIRGCGNKFFSDDGGDPGITKACEKAQNSMAEAIEEMNFCKTNSDCILLNGCPYGCNLLINKDADWDDLAVALDEAGRECGECKLRCNNAFRTDQVLCENGKCVGKNN